MVMNPKYGVPGVVALPYYLVFELLGPVVELLGYVAFVIAVVTGQASAAYTVAFLALAVFLGSAISISAVALEEISFRRYRRFSDLLALLGVALVESFGYRQMSTWWRLRGLAAAARSDRKWGAMERRGLEQPAGQVDGPANRDELATKREVPVRKGDAEVEIVVTDKDAMSEESVPK
jgi:hypothetical protein